MQMVTPYALSSIGYKYYIVYTIIGLTYIGSVYFLYPETMGLSLERIENLFQQDVSIPETVSLANRWASLAPDADVQGDQSKEKVEQIEHSKAESV